MVRMKEGATLGYWYKDPQNSLDLEGFSLGVLLGDELGLRMDKSQSLSISIIKFRRSSCPRESAVGKDTHLTLILLFLMRTLQNKCKVHQGYHSSKAIEKSNIFMCWSFKSTKGTLGYCNLVKKYWILIKKDLCSWILDKNAGKKINNMDTAIIFFSVEA